MLTAESSRALPQPESDKSNIHQIMRMEKRIAYKVHAGRVRPQANHGKHDRTFVRAINAKYMINEF